MGIAYRDGLGTIIRSEGTTGRRPLGPRVLQESEDFFIAETTNKDHAADIPE